MYPTYSQLWDADIERSMLFPFNREFFLQSLLSFPGLKIIWPFQETSGSVALATNDALALGRELVINGDFASDTIWTKQGGWTIAAGVASRDGTAGSSTLFYVEKALGYGKTYEITYTVTNYAAGTVQVFIGTDATATALKSANGTYTEEITAPSSGTKYLAVQGVSGFQGDIDNVSIKQTDIAAYTAFPGAELVTNGDFAGGITSWIDYNTPTTKEVVAGRMHIVGDAAADGFQQVVTTTTGLRFSWTFDYEVISGAMAANIGGMVNSGALTGSGTLSGEWIGQAPAYLRFQTSGGAGEFYIDNISVTEANPLNGDIIGCTIGQPSGLPGLPYLYSSEGISNYVDIHCAELNSMLDPASDFSIAIVGQSDTWVAGIDYLLRLAVDANNSIEIYRSGTDLVAVFVAGGTAETIIITSGSPSTPFIIEITREGNDFSAYYNGVLDSTETIAGAYVGNLDSTLCAVGAKNITPTNVWAGDYGIPYIFFTRARNADEIAQTAKLLGLLS